MKVTIELVGEELTHLDAIMALVNGDSKPVKKAKKKPEPEEEEDTDDEEDTDEEDTDDDDDITIDQLRKAVAKKLKDGKEEKVRALLSTFKAATLSKLKEVHYAKFFNGLQKIK